MKPETSYGIIPLRKKAGKWCVFLIQHSKGSHWAFPKGHGEKGEKPQTTAERELFEETGFSVKRYLTEETFIESYWFTRDNQPIHKTVHYYLAEVKGRVKLQSSEIFDGRWMPLSEAEAIITYPECRKVLHQAQSIL